jgi:hypothetical protein
MKHWKLTQWCVHATGRIRYSPDRAAVHEELRQHLDDRSDGFLAKGFSEEEAIEKTLDAMGDPAELAPLLAQIHKPFWGYAQDVCKWAFRLVAIAALVFMLYSAGRHLIYTDYTQPEANGWFSAGSISASNDTLEVPHTVSNRTYTDSGYHLTLTRAMTRTHTTEREEIAFRKFYFQLRIQTSFPWQNEPAIGDYLWAQDSLGNIYPTYPAGRPTYSDPCVYAYRYHNAPLTWVLEGRIYDFTTEEVTWLDLHYSRDGREMVWRIEMTGGDGT